MSENTVLIWQYEITICITSKQGSLLRSPLLYPCIVWVEQGARFARPLLYPIVPSFVHSAYLHMYMVCVMNRAMKVQTLQAQRGHSKVD